MMILMVFDTEEEKNKFIRIYKKYDKILYYTIGKFLDNIHDIEDYMQDIYMILGKNLDKIDEANDKKTRNYIITIARNYCISHWRAVKFEETEFIESDIGTEGKDDPLNILISQESYNDMLTAVLKLDEKYRAALELKCFNDLDDETIAHILNINKKNVQMRVYRAKQMVRQHIGDLKHE